MLTGERLPLPDPPALRLTCPPPAGPAPASPSRITIPSPLLSQARSSRGATGYLLAYPVAPRLRGFPGNPQVIESETAAEASKSRRAAANSAQPRRSAYSR